MFFTPVYNAWYGIWFLLPGLLLGNISSVMYVMFSSWGYIYYGHQDLHEITGMENIKIQII